MDEDSEIVEDGIRALREPGGDLNDVPLPELRELVRRSLWEPSNKGPLGDVATAGRLKAALVSAIEEAPWGDRGSAAIFLLGVCMDDAYEPFFVELGKRAIQEGRADKLTQIVFALGNVAELQIVRLAFDEHEEARRVFDAYLATKGQQ
ncbi:MAG TPA: hypothetical protein VGM88_27260 [Kofleriaceae bacterium]|jgi:hypothetical protein